MAYAKTFSKVDRRESDLLLNVVFAHMAFSSAKDRWDRKVAHESFKEAVRILYHFMTARTQEEGAGGRASSAQSSRQL